MKWWVVFVCVVGGAAVVGFDRLKGFEVISHVNLNLCCWCVLACITAYAMVVVFRGLLFWGRTRSDSSQVAMCRMFLLTIAAMWAFNWAQESGFCHHADILHVMDRVLVFGVVAAVLVAIRETVLLRRVEARNPGTGET